LSIFLPFAALFVLLGSTGSISRPIAGEEALLPVTYGQVLYRYNKASPKQLYIVGISHEDTLTGSSSPYTPRVEAEVYRIGAWLAREKGVELLLPEGFFAKPGGKSGVRNTLQRGSQSYPAETDLKLLERLFSEDKSPETLLSENFRLVMKQVEERNLYLTVHEGIRRLSDCTNLQQHFLIRSELNYYQDRRVGAMLQNIPKVISEAVLQGHVRKENALFTIGLSHIPSILRFLRDEKVAVACPLFTTAGTKLEECSDELSLSKEGFGVTVILPRTLADDQRLLKRNRIKSS
jgi:hypothetical protein